MDMIFIVHVVDEISEDIESIRDLVKSVFTGDGEDAVIDKLRHSCPVFISLVAKVKGKVVGHILFTPVRIVQNDGSVVTGMGLAPLAVHPDYQGMDIGTQLCQAGLKRMEKEDYPFVVVLGHPKYYPRFGFVPASEFGIKPSFPNVPEEAFMIHILDWKVMEGVSGVVYYRPEFDEIS